MGNELQISIDEDVCMGTGTCAHTAPATFAVDRDRFVAVLLDGPRDPADAIREAAAACPTEAIIVTESTASDGG